MSGTPVIRLAKKMFAGLKLNGFEGILNGTSNYVLGRMEAGLDFEAAISEAQELGYAEANPAADIEGYDVQLKVLILANELLDAGLELKDVQRQGISTVTPVNIQKAAREGRRWKLVGAARRNLDGSVTAGVSPVALPLDHGLAGVSGATNAVSFDTDLLGAVTVSGPGAGRVETAYALLSDIIAMHAARTGVAANV
jgi:homoserine dehydrogenase